MERYTEKAKNALILAGEAAEDLGSRTIGTEHLLVGLIEEGTGTAAKVLEANAVKLASVLELVQKLVSTYQSKKCLKIIHSNDTARAKEVFAEFCPGWTDEQFREAEILVAGIEHATLNAIDKTVPLETRISGALNTIMMIYNVPEEIRRIKIEKVLAIDYRSIGKRIFNEFREYVEKANAF